MLADNQSRNPVNNRHESHGQELFGQFGYFGDFWPPFLFLTLFLLVLFIDTSVIVFAHVLVCFYALMGPKHAIKALSLNYLILFLNPAVQVLSAEAGILRWAALFFAGLRIIPAIKPKSFHFLVPLLFFFGMVTALSWNSPNFAISFLKITVFTYCAATVLTAFDTLDFVELDELKTWFLAIAAVVILVSLPTLTISRVGFYVNGTGFQGILNHPQLLGIFVAPIAAYLGACLLLKSCPQCPYVWGFWGGVMVIMILTRARTALVTLFLSLAATLLTGLLSSRRATLKLVPSRTLISTAIAVTIIGAGVVASPTVSKSIEGFWLKGNARNLGDSFYASRGVGISFFWNRFIENPLTGHGFGIDVTHGSDKKPFTFLGIPISASTEKGFLPAAFLEEVGLLGLAFFTPLLLFLFRRIVTQVDVGLIGMCFACLFVNIGEAVFFSPGQVGGYFWLLIGLATAKGWAAAHEV
ncbi:MAG: hypothetical protein AB9866_25160 [Syntrophobacteraceae bacterium]